MKIMITMAILLIITLKMVITMILMIVKIITIIYIVYNIIVRLTLLVQGILATAEEQRNQNKSEREKGRTRHSRCLVHHHPSRCGSCDLVPGVMWAFIEARLVPLPIDGHSPPLPLNCWWVLFPSPPPCWWALPPSLSLMMTCTLPLPPSLSLSIGYTRLWELRGGGKCKCDERDEETYG